MENNNIFNMQLKLKRKEKIYLRNLGLKIRGIREKKGWILEYRRRIKDIRSEDDTGKQPKAMNEMRVHIICIS
ncbi:MAG: hypothetical protein OXB84_06750 [Halobacteriovoraceae bacterium]|nr:hypothetical protein [Halobacteriovoraceae bacterium]